MVAPHWHGLSYGYKNPRVDVSSERLVQDAGPADADVQPPSLSTKEQVDDNDGGDDEESIESLDGEELIEEGGTVPDWGRAAAVKGRGRGRGGHRTESNLMPTDPASHLRHCQL